MASGDNGNSATGSDCAFVPDVVGASPWVTSVGATMPSLDAKPYCAAEGFREEFGQCEELGQATTGELRDGWEVIKNNNKKKLPRPGGSRSKQSGKSENDFRKVIFPESGR